jgi:hypothetical protein
MFGVEHPARPTVFTPILLIAAAIGAIFDDIGAVTNTTTMRNYFLNHNP